jgi:hypothetical protein
VVTPADVFHDGELKLGEGGYRLDRHPVWMSRLAAGPLTAGKLFDRHGRRSSPPQP